MPPLWARELAAALLSGGGWACREAGTEAVLGHGAAEALTGHVAQRHWGHACCHRRRGTIGVPPNVEDSGLCNGAGAGPARRYRQWADQRRSAQPRIYGVAKTCDGAQWAGQRGAEWAFGEISEGLLGGLPRPGPCSRRRRAGSCPACGSPTTRLCSRCRHSKAVRRPNCSSPRSEQSRQPGARRARPRREDVPSVEDGT